MERAGREGGREGGRENEIRFSKEIVNEFRRTEIICIQKLKCLGKMEPKSVVYIDFPVRVKV